MITAERLFEFASTHAPSMKSDHAMDFAISKPVGYSEIGPGTVSFLKKLSAGAQPVAVPSALVFCTAETASMVDGPHVVTDNPRLAFARIVGEFFRPSWEIDGIHPSAHVHPDARIGQGVRIGANCVVASSASIGDHTVLHHNVVVGPNVEIGSHCVIRSSTVIGEEGFGVEELPNDETFRIPHIGGVRIGSHVNIGNLNSISAGTLKPTVIHDHVQIDNLVNIAHNCEVGAASMIMPCVMMAGSSSVGKRSYVGCNASITNGIALGDDCQVGLGAVVIRSSESNKVLAGNPARVLRDRRP